MKEALPTSPHRSRRCAATIASHHHGALAWSESGAESGAALCEKMDENISLWLTRTSTATRTRT